jgi:hypothetical protein
MSQGYPGQQVLVKTVFQQVRLVHPFHEIFASAAIIVNVCLVDVQKMGLAKWVPQVRQPQILQAHAPVSPYQAFTKWGGPESEIVVFRTVPSLQLLLNVLSHRCISPNAMTFHKSNQISLSQPRRRLCIPLLAPTILITQNLRWC